MFDHTKITFKNNKTANISKETKKQLKTFHSKYFLKPSDKIFILFLTIAYKYFKLYLVTFIVEIYAKY